jgi:RNA polymerase sigma-70 factor (ECF subfamily)
VATTSLRAPKPIGHDPEGSYELDEQAMDVIQALKRLPDRQRAAFVLFYLDDQPTSRIAELLGMAPATVSVHLHRARRRLREILGDADD